MTLRPTLKFPVYTVILFIHVAQMLKDNNKPAWEFYAVQDLYILATVGDQVVKQYTYLDRSSARQVSPICRGNVPGVRLGQAPAGGSENDCIMSEEAMMSWLNSYQVAVSRGDTMNLFRLSNHTKPWPFTKNG